MAMSKLVPLLMFLMFIIAFWILLARAAAAGRDLSSMICEDNGKVSSERVMKLATFCVAVWVVSVVLYAYPEQLQAVFGMFVGIYAVTETAKAMTRTIKGDDTPAEEKP